MFDVITGSFFALLVLPFFGTIILAGIISLAGRGASRKVLISASTGIGTAWVWAFVLGIPSFQNTFDSNSMPHIILVGLLLGALIDHLLPELGNKYKTFWLLLNLYLYKLDILSFMAGFIMRPPRKKSSPIYFLILLTL